MWTFCCPTCSGPTPPTAREAEGGGRRPRRDAETVIIDEIQKVPQLLEVVHALIEEKRGLRPVLTGSSARKLRREASTFLARPRDHEDECIPSSLPS
ncbi:MAG: AAA family ATPase [Desulfobacterales bacterium]|nr:AAA family ATPase [Desulfobacterales bacterium]